NQLRPPATDLTSPANKGPHFLPCHWGASQANEMPLLEAVIFSSLWAFGLGQATLEQHEISVSRARDRSARISCNVSAKDFNSETIYWYQQKPDQEIEYLTDVITNPVQVPLDGKNNKFEASKNTHTSTSTLKINFLEKEDEAMYYCGSWNWIH
ncbi:unnamed protein product, partial [Gulo gulo]